MHARICSYIKADGMHCRAVAIAGRSLCFSHQRLLRRSRRQQPVRSAPAIHLGSLADHHSILLAMSRVLQAVASGSLNLERAGALLKRIRIANDTLADHELTTDSRKTVAPDQSKVQT